MVKETTPSYEYNNVICLSTDEDSEIPEVDTKSVGEFCFSKNVTGYQGNWLIQVQTVNVSMNSLIPCLHRELFWFIPGPLIRTVQEGIHK